MQNLYTFPQYVQVKITRKCFNMWNVYIDKTTSQRQSSFGTCSMHSFFLSLFSYTFRPGTATENTLLDIFRLDATFLTNSFWNRRKDVDTHTQKKEKQNSEVDQSKVIYVCLYEAPKPVVAQGPTLSSIKPWLWCLFCSNTDPDPLPQAAFYWNYTQKKTWPSI